jgi:hypothetical protein
MRPLNELLSAIDSVVAADPTRSATRATAEREALHCALALPLVHRTGRPGTRVDWREILLQKRFAASQTITNEERSCGYQNAVYFFLGCAAYPKGNVVFLINKPSVDNADGTFSPFDSGGLSCGALSSVNLTTESERARFLRETSGVLANLSDFSAPYLAAHFTRPSEYPERPQRSLPDFEPYHLLRSTQNDRRAWTIEVRVHGDVPISPDEKSIRAIVVGNRALLSDIPDDFCGFCLVPDTDGDSDGDVVSKTIEVIRSDLTKLLT